MRVTSFSTAAICSLGFLAAYGISNKVNSTPNPEAKKDQPVAPTPAPKLPIAAPIAQAVAPPEAMANPLSHSQRLAEARRQREARLAQELAQIPAPTPRAATTGAVSLPKVNIPSVKSLPLDQIVAKSVGDVKPAQIARVAPRVPTASRPSHAIAKPERIAARPPAPRLAAAPPTVPAATQIAAQTAARTATTPPLQSPGQSGVSTNPAAQPPAPVARLASSTLETATEVKTAIPAAATSTNPTLTPTNQTTPNQTAKPQSGHSQSAQPETSQTAQAATATPVTPTPVAPPASTPAPETAPIALTIPASAAVTQLAAQTIAQIPPAPTEPPSPPAAVASSAQPATPGAQTAPQTAPQLASHTAPPTPVPQAAPQAVTQPYSAPPINVSGVDQTYTLGPGDQLTLSFFNVPEYNGSHQVLADGTLNLPLVGSVPVSGLTLQQAEAEIAGRYQSELRYAVVTASLAQARPLQVAIVGEVQQPGSYQLALTGNAQFPGIIQAIQSAGGTTQAADLRNIQVLRSTQSHPGQTIAVNLVDLLQSGNLDQDLRLRDGDRILIPTAAVVDFAEASQFSASNFAANPAQPFDIAIVGEVARPGAYKMGGGQSAGRPTVTQAIQLAGGIKPAANLRQIQIRRPTRTGAEQVIDIDFWQLLQSGNLSQDISLQQGDRITIPTSTATTNAETTLMSAANLSPATIRVNIVGEVNSPGVVEVPPGSSLNQAILAAGGPNNRSTREIELIRLDANGVLSRRTLRVEMKEGFNTDDNPMILNNDIIVVGRSGMAQLSDDINQVNSVVGPLLQLIPFRFPSPF